MDLINDAFHCTFPIYEFARVRYTLVEKWYNPWRVKPNEMFHKRKLSGPSDRLVTAPNNDTLYSLSWLDLEHGPVEVTIPRIDGGRYWSVQFMDAMTNNFALSSRRTDGDGGMRLWLARSDWEGQTPADVRLVRAPSRDVWMLIRVLVTGPGDVAAGNAVQDGLKIAPVGKATVKYLTQGVNPPEKPDADTFLRVVNEMLLRNDGELLDEFEHDGASTAPAGTRREQRRERREERREARQERRDARRQLRWQDIGIGLPAAGTPTVSASWWPGASSTAQPLVAPPDAVARWEQRLRDMTRTLNDAAKRPWKEVNGWTYPPPELGKPNSACDTRAVLALWGLGALPQEEALYLTARKDDAGRDLSGTSSYRLTIPAKGVAAKAFWSISLYEVMPDGRLFFVKNAIDRYTISDRTNGLTRNPDGTIDIIVSAIRPDGALAANWLPAPGGSFQLMVRAYLPEQSAIEGTAPLPRIQAIGPAK